MKLYLDIDGVLLTVKQPRIADDAESFIDFITNHFDCFWLSTHCKGNSASAIKYLIAHYGGNTLEQLKKIKTTDWATLKTEAIDFSSDFFWLEDNPFKSEIKVLDAHAKADKLIIVDLNRIDELKRVMTILKIG